LNDELDAFSELKEFFMVIKKAPVFGFRPNG
jgi:hypothetical protein